MRDTEGAAKQNPHVACDVEGAGDVAWPRRLGLNRRASPRPYLRGRGGSNVALLPDNSRCRGPNRAPTGSCRPEPKPSTARCATCSPPGIRLWLPTTIKFRLSPLRPEH